jgi:hypothetical protein
LAPFSCPFFIFVTPMPIHGSALHVPQYMGVLPKFSVVSVGLLEWLFFKIFFI